MLPDLNNQMIPCPITIELLGIDNKDFLGLKVSRFNSQTLSSTGYFFFLNQEYWQMTDEEKQNYGSKQIEGTRIKKDSLEYQYWLKDMLVQNGFDYIFDNTKFNNQYHDICWEVLSNGDDSKNDPVKEDVLESYLKITDFDKSLRKVNKKV